MKLALKKIFPLRNDVIRIQFGGVQRTGLYAVGIFTNVMLGTDAKFLIKSSLFVQMFKGVCPAETKDWLCF